MKNYSQRELLSLVEALSEETATRADIARLEKIVLGSPEALKTYVEAISLHGMLYWDAAGQGAEPGTDSAITASFQLPPGVRKSEPAGKRRSYRRLRELLTGVAVLVILKLSFAYFSPRAPQLADTPRPPAKSRAVEPVHPDVRTVPDVRLSETPVVPVPASIDNSKVEESVQATNPIAIASTFTLTDDAQVIDQINDRLFTQWVDAKVKPAGRASDSEWVRRLYLDLAGRIPTAVEVESFFHEKNPDKRTMLVDSLLSRRDFSHHLATTWTNLLVGRARQQEIERESLLGWLEQEFNQKRSWQEIVTSLIAARGTSRENAPANFLLTHLNNEAVPATAITSRIFLCEQLQCTQCHQHPTVKSWGQERFWELNAFFQQSAIRESRVVDASTGKKQTVRELVDAEKFGPTYYETLRGVMKVAYPKFAGMEIDQVEGERQKPLRERLSTLLFADHHPQPARAFVNRTWAQLMGVGFTNPVDDMGPHTPVSHPELLEELTAAFVQSGYDVHRLVRWICLSDAYQLSSRSAYEAEEYQDRPLFNRMAVKSLSAEQLFDSLRIASGMQPEQLLSRDVAQQRESWLRQFYSAVDTEENGEETTFDGSLPQALMMMNGDLVQQATNSNDSHVLISIATKNGLSEADRIRQLSLAALSRYPTSDELNQLRDILRRTIRQRISDENLPPQLALAEGLKDVYWAYLNSSEFALNH